MKILEWLFKSGDSIINKNDYKYINPNPEEVLTNEQIKKSLDWYKLHKIHVDKLSSNILLKYPPSLNEDKRDCRLLKPEHWSWFLDFYGK